MGTRWIITLAMFVAVSWSTAAGGADAVVRSTKGEFRDVKERVLHAIENRGLVLNYTARIGAMLERTGKDIGSGQPVYREAELLEFCSARLSRDAMEADPRNIVYCPYGIAVYTLPGDPGRVYVAYRRQGASGADRPAKARLAVDKFLDDIVAEALK